MWFLHLPQKLPGRPAEQELNLAAIQPQGSRGSSTFAFSVLTVGGVHRGKSTVPLPSGCHTVSVALDPNVLSGFWKEDLRWNQRGSMAINAQRSFLPPENLKSQVNLGEAVESSISS